MKLSYKLDSLDGLDEGLKGLYAKVDGKFVLQLDENPAQETISKLTKEKSEIEKAMKAIADEKEAKEREAEEAKARATGDFEKLKQALSSENKGLKDEVESLRNHIKNGARDRAAMEAIQAANGIPKALLPHIQGQLEVIPDGEDFKVVVKGNPGQKLTDFVTGLKADMPWGFNGSGASGGGAPQPGNPAQGGGPKTSVQLIAEGLKDLGKK